MLSSRRIKHRQARTEDAIRVGDQAAKDATRWLGMWLDSALTSRENRSRCTSRTRQAEPRLQRLTTKHGVPRPLHEILTWPSSRGPSYTQRNHLERQKCIGSGQNRMGCAALSTFQPTPVGTVEAESKLTPAGPLLDHRQACFAQRLLTRPQVGRGPEDVMMYGSEYYKGWFWLAVGVWARKRTIVRDKDRCRPMS